MKGYENQVESTLKTVEQASKNAGIAGSFIVDEEMNNLKQAKGRLNDARMRVDQLNSAIQALGEGGDAAQSIADLEKSILGGDNLLVPKKSKEEIAKELIDQYKTPVEMFKEKMDQIMSVKDLLPEATLKSAISDAEKELSEAIKVKPTDRERQAKELIESMKTPLQKFKDRVAELQGLRDLIPPGTFETAMKKAYEEFKSATQSDPLKLKADIQVRDVTALAAGSSEALSQILSYQQLRSNMGMDQKQPQLPASEVARIPTSASSRRFQENQAIAREANRQFGPNTAISSASSKSAADKRAEEALAEKMFGKRAASGATNRMSANTKDGREEEHLQRLVELAEEANRNKTKIGVTGLGGS
jgi:hypothetical protein